MKANELMIGDWVYDTILKCNTQVEMLSLSGIRGDCHDNIWNENTFEPIPLTAEILEKNRFKYKEGETGMYGVTTAPHYICDGIPFEVFCDGELFAIWFKEPVNIKFVHELQHALRLCKTDKTIEL